MIGFRYSSLFRSRWSALFWAAGILYTAYSVADSAPGGSDDEAVNSAQENAATAAVAQAFK